MYIDGMNRFLNIYKWKDNKGKDINREWSNFTSIVFWDLTHHKIYPFGLKQQDT